jgi:hypothetical protein
MKLLVLSILLLLPVSARAYIMPSFEPKDLGQADTILFAPLNSIKVFRFPGQSGGLKTAWDITAPLALLGRAAPTEHIMFTDHFYPYQANKTAELLFLRRNGESLKPVGELGWAVGVSGKPASLATELKGIQPDMWSLLAHCLMVEKDPACALHLSYILSEAPPRVLQTTWNTLANRRGGPSDLWLAYENIGLHVVGVAALDGFIEPGINKDSSPYDKDGSQGARLEIVNPMFTWLYYGHDTEDYHHLLAFARNQRGRVGEAAIRGTTNLTQKSDLPQLLDIFQHAPDIAIRYACLEHFYRILGRPSPSEIPGFDVFQKHEAKYVRIWKERISNFTSS